VIQLLSCIWVYLQIFRCQYFNNVKRQYVTRQQGLLTPPEHLSSTPVFSGVRVNRSLVLYVCFVDRYCPFVLFLLAIVLNSQKKKDKQRFTKHIHKTKDRVPRTQLKTGGLIYISTFFITYFTIH
jgi:hypothetical protein